ncbi:unnamed protein product [Clonostachys rhizophaga]|uniref:Zn(2)-C6 fungal-type domain-containing protein n=1 Tax=Clonostachys rhizophaga TaxID=160324 RepID=A0A9N9YGV2_9HYPO|nr:unnamed protein product [Clonostachys rhizophaga]
MSTGEMARQPAHRRSRTGCYTCRFRKVRCQAVRQSPAGNNNEEPGDCANCQRLGFQCRWRPPPPGEQYDPPPKRRRTTGRRVRGDRNEVEASASTSVLDDGALAVHEGDAIRSAEVAESPKALLSEQPAEDNQSMRAEENFFDPDFTLDSGFLDLNLAGEGLDFIPLPAVDTSLWAESIYDEASMQWPSPLDISEMAQQLEDNPNTSTLRDQDDLSASVTDRNRHLIQHYLEVIKGYSKVDERSKETNNLFISAFSRSLSFPPLFYAILAFSASHISMEDDSHREQAAKFDRLAAESFRQFKSTHETEVDSLLSALFVRIKMIHVMGGSVEAFLKLIDEAIDILTSVHGLRALGDTSALAWRIIVRIAILDARASCYRLGGGKLIKALRKVPSFSFLFSSGSTDAPSLGAVVNLLRADIFRTRVAEIDLQLHQQIQSEFITSTPMRTEVVRNLYSDIQNEIQRWERHIRDTSRNRGLGDVNTGNDSLDSTTYGSYAVFTALHSSLLYLHHIFPLSMCHQDTSISTILRYQLKVDQDVSRAASPSSILPSSLFVAGLLTTDPIHRDWVVKILKKGERWGLYIQKARKLLEAIARMQSEGAFVSVYDAMSQITERFII